jgi:hypothetical protein
MIDADLRFTGEPNIGVDLDGLAEVAAWTRHSNPTSPPRTTRTSG